MWACCWALRIPTTRRVFPLSSVNVSLTDQGLAGSCLTKYRLSFKPK